MLTKDSSSTPVKKIVVLKCAPENGLQREKAILQQYRGNANIRQLIDHSDQPPCLVLEHLESEALKASSKAKLSRPDITFTAHSILSALESLHSSGIAHTGDMTYLRTAKMDYR